MDIKFVDKRVAMRYVEKGVISREEYRKYLSSLEDQTDKCEQISVSLYPKEGEGAEAESPAGRNE